MTNPVSIALSGLTAATARVNAAAGNIANAGTSGATENGNGPAPYTPVDVIQTSIPDNGVVAELQPRTDGTTQVYQPDSPYADPNGLVAAPNVDLANEIVQLNDAANAYRANAAVIRVANEMEKELFGRFDETV